MIVNMSATFLFSELSFFIYTPNIAKNLFNLTPSQAENRKR